MYVSIHTEEKKHWHRRRRFLAQKWC